MVDQKMGGYRCNSSEIVGFSLSDPAYDRQLRLQQDRELREQNRKLREQDRLLREQDKLLREQDILIREKDRLIRKKERARREQDRVNRDQDGARWEHDRALREHDRAKRERERTKREKDRVNREKERARWEQDRVRREQDGASQEHVRASQIQNVAMCSQETAIQHETRATRYQNRARPYSIPYMTLKRHSIINVDKSNDVHIISSTGTTVNEDSLNTTDKKFYHSADLPLLLVNSVGGSHAVLVDDSQEDFIKDIGANCKFSSNAKHLGDSYTKFCEFQCSDIDYVGGSHASNIEGSQENYVDNFNAEFKADCVGEQVHCLADKDNIEGSQEENFTADFVADTQEDFIEDQVSDANYLDSKMACDDNSHVDVFEDFNANIPDISHDDFIECLYSVYVENSDADIVETESSDAEHSHSINANYVESLYIDNDRDSNGVFVESSNANYAEKNVITDCEDIFNVDVVDNTSVEYAEGFPSELESSKVEIKDSNVDFTVHYMKKK